MLEVKEDAEITLDGEKVTIYLCDRKAKCKNGKHCGKECKLTLDINHAVIYEQMTMLN